MEDIIEVIIPIVIAIVWIGGVIVKKIGQAAQKQRTAGGPHPSGDDRQREAAIRATQDEVRAFLQQMGAAPPPRPAPRPAPAPASTPKPAAARQVTSAADALKAAAARRARRAKPITAASEWAAPGLKPKRKSEKRVRKATYRAAESAAAVSGEDPIPGLSGLPFMHRAVMLREILGPPPGLGRGPLEREA